MAVPLRISLEFEFGDKYVANDFIMALVTAVKVGVCPTELSRLILEHIDLTSFKRLQ